MRLRGWLVWAPLAIAWGCSAPLYPLEGDDLARFKAAGPPILEVDRDKLVAGLPPPGPYRIIGGDLLEIIGPPELFGVDAQQQQGRAENRLVRVDAEGMIQTDVAGRVSVGGLTVPEAEQAILTAAYPKFLVKRPAIVVRVAEHYRRAVTVLGAVESPGIHELRHDQLSLYGALAAAGGILKTNNLVVGARLIRILKPDRKSPEVVVLPVRGLNIPASDVVLKGGETVEVERYEPDTFTVVGLVGKPGAYAYPPEIRYNLMQALAVAGGVDRLADPPYATVFRKDRDGTIIPATFEIGGYGLVVASDLAIKPGDVIVVEHTTASWTRALIAEIFRIQFGFFVDERTFQ